MTQDALAATLRIHGRTTQAYELGTRVPRWWAFPELAAALGVPVAQLLTDDLVLAEIRVSSETLERVKREGAPAAQKAAERIATGLTALLIAEATRPPVDVSPGARPKRRRSREEVLAGIAAAKRRSAQKNAARRARERARIE